MPTSAGEPIPVSPFATAEPEAPLLRVAACGARRRWRLIALVTLVAGVAGVPVALSMTRWYAATVRLVPTPSRHHEPRLPGFEPIEGATPEDVTGPGGAQGGAELGRLLSILHSRTLADAMIEKFDLARVYGVPSLDAARGLFWNRLAAASLVAKEGFVELSVEDPDPRRAAAIANEMAEGANRVMRRLSSSAATAERTFLERRLDGAREAMQRSAEALSEFQRRHRVINVEAQASGVIATVLRLRGQLIDEELERDRLVAFASRAEPAVRAAERRIAALKREIARLEGPAASPDFLTRLSAVPSLRTQAERLAEDLKEKRSVYALLLRECELARLAEVRDTRTFEVLDPAVPPARKSRPSGLLVVLATALGGFVLAFALAGARSAWPVLRARLDG